MKKALMLVTSLLLATSLGLSGCSQTRTQKTAGEQVDDTVTTAKVKSALINDPVTKARNIDVEVFRGVVSLGGYVGSDEEKSRAGEVAKKVNGVVDVKNNLQVQSQVAERSAGEVVDDGVVTAKVKAALIEDPMTKAHQINVDTKNGVVLLSGFVDSKEAKMEAGQVAQRVSGVQSVRNELEIKQNP
jgi:hyperosmotically inducible protein